jgi:adenylyltransferase/sulfurtransferase
LTDRDRDRYSRQLLLDRIGEEGQAKLKAGRIVIVGCGATGSNLANMLARSGVGHIILIDRDFVELDNLQRQVLFDEADVEQPKAVTAAAKLRAVNSDIILDAHVCDFNASNAEDLVKDADLILDGTDNMSTRFIINDIANKLGIPWIYSGAVGTYGMTMNIPAAEDQPCFRCFLPKQPRPGALQTCDTAGVINTIPQLITAYSGTEALKYLTGHNLEGGKLIISDIWDTDFRVVSIPKVEECPCCSEHNYEFLALEKCNLCTTLCGRNAVQVRPAGHEGEINFKNLQGTLEKVGTVKITDYTLIFKTKEHHITLFKDGRAIIQGVSDESEALSIYSKYIGL